MHKLVFTFIIVIFYSCIQKNQEKIAETQKSKIVEIDTLEINDSMDVENYSVNADTVYFYARPDTNTKLNAYLTRNDLTLICSKKGDFGYSILLTDSSTEPRGWLQLKHLTKILFTAPKVVNE